MNSHVLTVAIVIVGFLSAQPVIHAQNRAPATSTPNQGAQRLQLRPGSQMARNLELVPQSSPIWPMGVDLSADEKLIAFGGNDGVANLWSLETGRKLRTYTSQELSAYPIAFHPDGSSLLIGAGPKIVRYDIATGRKLLELLGIPTGTQEIKVSRDGHRLVAYSLLQQGKESISKTLVWDPRDGRKLQEISHPAWHTKPVIAWPGAIC